jgi:DNA-binding NarL/FixJ family response regulator
VTRVAIVAAAPAFRDRLESIVGSAGALTVSATASSVDALASNLGVASSEVVLLHAGAELGARFLDAMPPIPVVVLVGRRVPPSVLPAMLAAGVRGILPDDATRDEIAAAVDAAIAGLVVVPAEMVSDLVASRPQTADGARDFAAARPQSTVAAPSLTPREREILSMLAEGLPNKLIAARLAISEHTVKTHLEAIFEKLGASTRAEAVALGVRRGLLLL